MPRRASVFLLSVLLFAVAISPAPGGDDAAELVARLRKKYDRIRDISLEFRQTTVFAVSKARQTSSGRLALAKGNRYRITFDDRVIVSDGETVWSWSNTTGQVIVDRFRENPNDLTAERLLTRIPAEYAALSLGTDTAGAREATVLKLTPRSAGQPVRWYKLWIHEGDLTVAKLQLLDLAENDVTYEIFGVAIDRGLPDTTFRFTVPPGTEVLDLR